MRLVLVTHFYPAHGGGIEIVAGKLVERFVHRGITACWFASNTDLQPDMGDRVVPVPITTYNIVERLTQLPYPLWSPLGLPLLWRAIGSADVVHVHEHLYPGSILAILIARMRGRPTVITQHMGRLVLPSALLTTFYTRSTQLLGKLIFPLAARRVFISANVRRFFNRELDPNSLLIFNGIDSNRFSVGTIEDRRRARLKLGIADERKVVLFVGRFVRKKGLHIIERLTALYPSVEWLIVGSGPEDPTRWVRQNVHVTGRLDHCELPNCYRAADLLLLPSVSEGFPLVVQEALCCGVGVLSTDEVVSACPQAAPLMRYCAEAAHGANPSPWEKALASVLADEGYLQDRETRSLAAHALWSWDRCADQYVDLIREIAN